MPTYEFRCPEGHEFEKFYRTISGAESVAACPQCGKPSERMISLGAGLHFKGSGFYITDYGKDGKKDQRAGKGTSDGAKKGAEAAPTASSGSDAASSGGSGGASGAAPAGGTSSSSSSSASSSSSSSGGAAPAKGSGGSGGAGGTT